MRISEDLADDYERACLKYICSALPVFTPFLDPGRRTTLARLRNFCSRHTGTPQFMHATG